MLTTITPVWNRPEMLRIWLEAIKGATFQGLRHLVFFVGWKPPEWVAAEYQSNSSFQFIQCHEKPGDLSIGHYHNIGARLTHSEWMMKLDVDALPNVRYFRELCGILRQAGSTEWFNGGMMYVSQVASINFLSAKRMPVSEETYNTIMRNPIQYCGSANVYPAATNFICRTRTYLALGGCDERFRGYGWEDYQQIYMLEKHQRGGSNPLPDRVTIENVTSRCCREISRLKARELWRRNPWLALLHHFHHSSPDPNYKSHEIMLRNRKILLEYITTMKTLIVFLALLLLGSGVYGQTHTNVPATVTNGRTTNAWTELDLGATNWLDHLEVTVGDHPRPTNFFIFISNLPFSDGTTNVAFDPDVTTYSFVVNDWINFPQLFHARRLARYVRFQVKEPGTSFNTSTIGAFGYLFTGPVLQMEFRRFVTMENGKPSTTRQDVLVVRGLPNLTYGVDNRTSVLSSWTRLTNTVSTNYEHRWVGPRTRTNSDLFYRTQQVTNVVQPK